MNGGKQSELLLRNVFMLHCSSSLTLRLSSGLRCCSISWRILENRELNSRLAKMGSLFGGEGGQSISDFIYFILFTQHRLHASRKRSYLCECLKRSDDTAVRDLDVGKVANSVVTIQSHLSLFPQPLICFVFLKFKPKLKLERMINPNL